MEKVAVPIKLENAYVSEDSLDLTAVKEHKDLKLYKDLPQMLVHQIAKVNAPIIAVEKEAVLTKLENVCASEDSLEMTAARMLLIHNPLKNLKNLKKLNNLNKLRNPNKPNNLKKKRNASMIAAKKEAVLTKPENVCASEVLLEKIAVKLPTTTKLLNLWETSYLRNPNKPNNLKNKRNVLMIAVEKEAVLTKLENACVSEDSLEKTAAKMHLNLNLLKNLMNKRKLKNLNKLRNPNKPNNLKNKRNVLMIAVEREAVLTKLENVYVSEDSLEKIAVRL